MTDFACGPTVSMQQHPVLHDARSQSGTEIQERDGAVQAIRTSQQHCSTHCGSVDIVFHMHRHACQSGDFGAHIQRNHIKIHDVAHVSGGGVDRARCADADCRDLVKAGSRGLPRNRYNVLDHRSVTMTCRDSGGVQHRARCIDKRRLDFGATHINTNPEIVHGVISHCLSPVLRRTICLESICIYALTTILTNYRKPCASYATRRDIS